MARKRIPPQLHFNTGESRWALTNLLAGTGQIIKHIPAKERQERIVAFIREHGKMLVNREGCPATWYGHFAHDVKALKKKGVIKQVRMNGYTRHYDRGAVNLSYLVLKEWKP